MTSVWGVSAVAILDSSVNCLCGCSTKKLTMPAYCVVANCNNLQMTPGITMHEFPHNWPAVRQKWIKFIQFIQFKRADFLAAPHHTHLCSEHLFLLLLLLLLLLLFVVVFRGYLNYACNSVSVNETCTITGETMYVFAYFVISSFISCERLDNQTFS